GALAESFGSWNDIRRTGLYKENLNLNTENQLERLAFWAKKENAKKLDWLSEGKVVSMPEEVYEVQNARNLAQIAEKKGCGVGAVLMSPPALQKLGIWSVCVVSAELQPLNLHGQLQYLGGKRLTSVPKLLGYPIATAAPSYPHPFP